jgi:hypothetical protein
LRTGADVGLAPDAPFLVVADGRVSAASAAAERILGRHLIGKPLAAVDLRGLEPTTAPCGDPPATLIVLRAA